MMYLFALTLATSAFLLFLIQPMFTKMVLPLLGGSPAVWNTAMVFFQAVLLLGYLYAHLSAKYFGTKLQALAQIAILLVAIAMLPIAVAAGTTPPAHAFPAVWLLGFMGTALGLPFFALATLAPTLQSWFAHTDHKGADNPYVLYAASNVGSLAALIGYPTVVEPIFRLGDQSLIWAAIYALLVALVATCAVFVWQRYRATAVDATGRSETFDYVEDQGWTTKLRWLMLAFAPASLLLGVTAHISTDLAAVPLLWVVPLALYLLTFVIVFSRRPALRHSWMLYAQALLVLALALFFYARLSAVRFGIPMHLATFFVVTMVCHGELARLRPPPARLTEFYLFMSLGGVLGGAFTALVAPQLFDTVLEYPLALVFACALRPVPEKNPPLAFALDVVWPGILALLILLPWLFGAHVNDLGILGMALFFALICAMTFFMSSRPVRFALAIAVLLGAFPIYLSQRAPTLLRARSFFGVYKVIRTEDQRFHVLLHGTTVHGVEFRDPDRYRAATTYYHAKSPIGRVLGTAGASWPKDVGAIGLGVGTLSCYKQPGQHWTYFEIDPEIEKLARDTRYFHFLELCGDGIDVVLGDARLKLAAQKNARYDLLVLDAFSSDAIPVHLLTREAIELYVDRLKPGGVIFVHISNRHLDLEPVLAEAAEATGLSAIIFPERLPRHRTVYELATSWVALARKEADLDRIKRVDKKWRPATRKSGFRLWTDDYSNILTILSLGHGAGTAFEW